MRTRATAGRAARKVLPSASCFAGQPFKAGWQTLWAMQSHGRDSVGMSTFRMLLSDAEVDRILAAVNQSTATRPPGLRDPSVGGPLRLASLRYSAAHAR